MGYTKEDFRTEYNLLKTMEKSGILNSDGFIRLDMAEKVEKLIIT